MVPERPTLGRLLWTTYDILAREVYGRLAEAGYADVRPAHGKALRHLTARGTRTVDLAAKAGMTKQSMAYLVDGLERLGYVEIAPDPTDRRARIVRLTPRGQAVRGALERLSAETEAGWSRAVGKEDWRIMRRVLERLAGSSSEGRSTPRDQG